MKTAALLVLTFLITNFSYSQENSTPATLNETTTKTSFKDYDDLTSGRSNFGVSLFSLGGIDRSQITNGSDQTPSMYFFENYLSLSYKISKDFRIAGRYSFNYSTAGKDKFSKDVTDKADTRDMSLLMTWYNVFEDSLPTYMSYKIQPRLYLPTSEKSKAQGMISSLRLENELRFNTDRYSNLRIWLNPQYFFQRSTAYLDDKGNAKTTEMFASKHGVEYSQNINKLFSIKPGFEIEDTWSNSSSTNNKDEFRNNTIDYRLGLEIRVSKPLRFTVGYGHRRDLIKPAEFSDGFTLMTNASLY